MHQLVRPSEIRLLVWLAIALAAVALLTLSAPILASFSDLATIFFLSWLLAFLIRPLATRVSRLFGRLPYGAAVGLAYVIVGLVTGLVIGVAAISLAESIQQLAASRSLGDQLAASLASVQAELDSRGLQSINLAALLGGPLEAVGGGSSQSLDTFGALAGSLAGAVGTLSVIVFVSVYMAADRDRLTAGAMRVVPAPYHHELDVVQDATGHSFGGFVRGQIVVGMLYGAVAFVACLVLDIPYAPLVGVTVAILQTIPYFGQYVSWAPPVVVAVLFQPAGAVRALVIMVVGLLVLANLVQPRVLGTAVGLSLLTVLVAVLIGAKVVGVPGAVFAVPVAAAALAIAQRLSADHEMVPADQAPSEPPPTGLSSGD